MSVLWEEPQRPKRWPSRESSASFEYTNVLPKIPSPKKLRMIFAAPILDLTMSKHARQGVIYERVVPLCSRWISPIPTRARQRLWFNLLVPFLKRRFQRILSLMISYSVFGCFWAKAPYIKHSNCQLHKQRWLKKATRYFHFLLIFYYHYLLTLVSFYWLLP